MGFKDIISTVFGGKGLASGVADIIGKFKADPTKVLEMQALVQAHEHEFRMKELEIEARVQEAITKEVEAASSNIRAEAQSGDAFTVRARPLFLYVVNGIFIFNYVLLPLGQQISGAVVAPIPLPSDLLALFGFVMLGYIGGRSWEKIVESKNGNGKNGR